MEIFPGGSGLSPSKEVNKGEIIIIIRSLLLQGATELLALGSRPFYVACKM